MTTETKPTALQILGGALRAARERAAKSKADIISDTGLNYSQVIAMEKGEKEYTTKSLLKYVEALDKIVLLGEKATNDGV